MIGLDGGGLDGQIGVAVVKTIDFRATEIAARTQVAADWHAEAKRYELVATNSTDEASRKIALLFAKDLRESADRLLETIQ